jgi:hypothetical protein
MEMFPTFVMPFLFFAIWLVTIIYVLMLMTRQITEGTESVGTSQPLRNEKLWLAPDNRPHRWLNAAARSLTAAHRSSCLSCGADPARRWPLD